MVVIISTDVLDSIDKYADALTMYPITRRRAHEKVDNMVNALIKLGNSPVTPQICMHKDLLQTFDSNGNPMNTNLKRFNYKDESQYQWAFACLYDYDNDTITILKMVGANYIKEFFDRIGYIVSEEMKKYVNDVIEENRSTRYQRRTSNRGFTRFHIRRI